VNYEAGVKLSINVAVASVSGLRS